MSKNVELTDSGMADLIDLSRTFGQARDGYARFADLSLGAAMEGISAPAPRRP